MTTEESPSRQAWHALLRVGGIMLIVTGLLAVIATNRETPILGAGMIPVGVLLLSARGGSRRAWRGFPWLPLVVAGLIALGTARAYRAHMETYRSAK